MKRSIGLCQRSMKKKSAGADVSPQHYPILECAFPFLPCQLLQPPPLVLGARGAKSDLSGFERFRRFRGISSDLKRFRAGRKQIQRFLSGCLTTSILYKAISVRKMRRCFEMSCRKDCLRTRKTLRRESIFSIFHLILLNRSLNNFFWAESASFMRNGMTMASSPLNPRLAEPVIGPT